MQILHVGFLFPYLPLISREQRKRGFKSDIAVSFDDSKIMADFFIGSRFKMRDAKLFKLGMKYNIIQNHSPHFSQFVMSLLIKLGKGVIKHYHGSDLRLWKKYEPNFCIVSTPDLLDRAPQGLWLPNPVDIEAFTPNKDFSNEIPVVLHYDLYVPSEFYSKQLYIAEIYERAFRKLKERGIKFTLRKVRDIPHDEMPAVINKSDIVVGKIDQTLGWYGSFSVEAMACEKPAVAYIRPDLYEKYKPPIYYATPDNLADKLQILIEDERLRKTLGERGRKYVQKIHNVKRIVDKLTNIYFSNFSI